MVLGIVLNLGADVNIQNHWSRSPLNYISAGPPGYSQAPNYPQLLANVARLLLDRGADINARNDKGRTPLHTTAYMGRIEVVRVLLERGADVNAKDSCARQNPVLVGEGK